jgi:hypothetical protein
MDAPHWGGVARLAYKRSLPRLASAAEYMFVCDAASGAELTAVADGISRNRAHFGSKSSGDESLHRRLLKRMRDCSVQNLNKAPAVIE